IILKFIEDEKKSYTEDFFSKSQIEKTIANTSKLIDDKFSRKKNIPDFIKSSILDNLSFFIKAFNAVPINSTEDIRKKVLTQLPKFVYYSDYGNLDSEIFLPRVIEDLERDDLTESARAKVRTLDVLFKYVGLSPTEIYEL